MPTRFQFALILLASLACGCASSEVHYATPQAAVDSFVTALRANDDTQLKKILGSEGDELLSSGDPVADQEGRGKFLAEYDKQHTLVEGKEPNSPYTLLVGDTQWPFPLPLTKDKNGWCFDTAEGKDEILNRRIG